MQASLLVVLQVRHLVHIVNQDHGNGSGRNGGFLLAGTYEFYHDSVAKLGRERARDIYRQTIAQIGRISETETPQVNRPFFELTEFPLDLLLGGSQMWLFANRWL